jgi:hypothetical protein
VIVKRDRSARFGRRYRAEAEIVYVGGTLPDDVGKDLIAAVERALGRGASDLSLTVSSDPFNRVSVSVTLTAARPLAAITMLDSALDDTLAAAGLTEEFDVTGRELSVVPVDRVWREGGTLGPAPWLPGLIPQISHACAVGRPRPSVFRRARHARTGRATSREPAVIRGAVALSR